MKAIKILMFMNIFCFGRYVKSQPNFTLAAGICHYDTLHLSANTGTLAITTYSWGALPSGANFSNPNSQTTSVNFFGTGTFTVTLMVTAGTQTSSIQHSISVFPSPTLNLTQSSGTTCITSNVPLMSKPLNLIAAGAIAYTWNPPPASGNANSPTITVRPITNTCYTVGGADLNGCLAMGIICTSVIPQFSIQVSATPSLICRPTIDGPDELPLLVMSNPSPPVIGQSVSHTYTWNPGSSILTLPFSSTVFVAPYSTTTYTAELRDSLTCISLQAYTTVSVQICTNVESIGLNNTDFNFYPNPAKEKVYISYPAHVVEGKLALINTLGQTVYTTLLPVQELTLSELSAGYYVLVITSDTYTRRVKVLKDE